MSDRNAITSQPRVGSNAVPTPSTILAEVPRELDRIANLTSIIFRPSRQYGCSPKEFEVLEDLEFRRIFRGVSSKGFCSCEDPAISITNIGDTREVLQLQIDPHNCCTSTMSGTISSPLGNTIGKAIQNQNWFSETFEMLDPVGNTVFLCNSRRRWNNYIPEFEITTTNRVSIGRITLSIHSFYGEELTLRWLIDDVSPLKRVLGLGFLLFLYLRIAGRYKNRLRRPIRPRSTYGYYEYRDYDD